MASKALSRMDGHEDVCAVRYEGINNTLHEIKRALVGQRNLMMGAQTFVILSMIGLIAWLANRAF